MGDGPTLSDWEALRDRWLDIQEEFDSFPAKAEDAANAAKLKEQTVTLKLVYPLLEHLRWKTDSPQEVFAEQHIKLQAGSKTKDVFPDYILVGGGVDATKPGKPFAVVEVKRYSGGEKSTAEAQEQARTYADFLRVPVYAVVDKQNITVWQRCLWSNDREVVNLPVGDLGNDARTTQLQKWLGRDSLPSQAKAWRKQEVNNGPKAAPPDFDEAPEHVAYIKLVAAENGISLRMTESTKEATTRANWWWGSPSKPGTDTPRVVILSGDVDLSRRGLPEQRELHSLLVRLLQHGGVEVQCSDHEEWNAWCQESETVFLLDGAHLANSDSRRASAPSGEWATPSKDVLDKAPLVTLDLWVSKVGSALDDWVVQCAKLDLDDQFSERPRRVFPRVEELRRNTKTCATAGLRRGYNALGSTVIGNLLALFWPTTGKTTDIQRERARHHLGPKTRFEVVEAVQVAAAVAASLSPLVFRSDYSEREQRANLDFGKGMRDAVLWGLDPIGSQTGASIERAFSWASVAVLRSTRAHALHESLGLRDLSKAEWSGLGSERVNDPKSTGLLFTLDGHLRESLQNGSWADIIGRLADQLQRRLGHNEDAKDASDA